MIRVSALGRQGVMVVLAWGLMLTAVTLLPGWSTALAASEPGRLVVSGQAELKVEPDMAVFQVGVETRAETLEQAREANAAAMQQIQGRLIEAGADPNGLKTQGYSVQPEWHYNENNGVRTLVGYRVSHTLEVTVADLGTLGVLLDAAVQAGANRVYGPTFGVSDTEALEAEALRQAVRRARVKAEALAQASGAFLKGILEIRESVSTPYIPALRSAAMAVDTMEFTPTPIQPGEVTVTAHVTITYEI